MTTRQDVEELLRGIPLSTPQEESHACDMLQNFFGIVSAAADGADVPLPSIGSVLSIPNLINQLKRGEYTEVAFTLIGMVGDAASVYGLLASAGIQAGAFTGLGVASSATVATAIGEIAPPALLAASVLVATFRIPLDVDENNKKLYFIADASGILTSWIFNLPQVNPHSRLMTRSRTGGYCRSDVSEGCRLAHRSVQELWRRNYSGNADAIRSAQESAGNKWQRYWRQVGAALEQRLVPLPHRMAMGWVRAEIREAKRRLGDESRERLDARRRQAAGGYWFRTPEGPELFMPDP